MLKRSPLELSFSVLGVPYELWTIYLYFLRSVLRYHLWLHLTYCMLCRYNTCNTWLESFMLQWSTESWHLLFFCTPETDQTFQIESKLCTLGLHVYRVMLRDKWSAAIPSLGFKVLKVKQTTWHIVAGHIWASFFFSRFACRLPVTMHIFRLQFSGLD